MKENNVPKSIFLDDIPCCEESSFEIHEAIANAVVEEVNNNEPSNIAVIADWGAGKSTILNLAKAKLGDSFVFLTFDAWAHYGETLRKSFIKMLIDEIKQSDPTSERQAAELARDLEGSESHTETEENTKLKPLAVGCLIGAALYAIASAIGGIISPPIESITFAETKSEQLGKIVSAVVMFLLQIVIPFFLGVFAYRNQLRKDGIPVTPLYLRVWEHAKRIVLRVRSIPSKYIEFMSSDSIPEIANSSECCEMKTSWFQANLNEFASIFAKTSSGTTSMTKFEKVNTLDSLRFEELFHRALSLTNKNVIIAFDNLDRLSKDALRETWGTVEIFCSTSAFPTGKKRPWVLLPISKQAFPEIEFLAFGKGTSDDPRSMTLSKLFIRNFEIPTLISTDWKRYFLSLAEQAFPGSDEQDLSSVYSIASHALLKVEMRTPRNAKRFINAMVAQSRVFNHIELISIAAFCYLKDAYELWGRNTGQNSAIESTDTESKPAGQVQSNKESITFSDFVTQATVEGSEEYAFLEPFSLSHERLQIELLMMAFGQFSEDKASEALVLTKINAALLGKNEVDFVSLVKNNIGSWEIIAETLQAELFGSPRNSTPQWIYPLLRSLTTYDHDFIESHEQERQRVVNLLMRRLVKLNPKHFRGSGNAIASHIATCPPDIARVIGNEVASQLEALLEAKNEESELNDVSTTLKDFIQESAPVLQAIANRSEGDLDLLPQSLGNLDFAEYYSWVIQCAAHTLCDNFARSWMAHSRSKSLEETQSALELLYELVSSKQLDHAVIVLTRDARLLEDDNIDNLNVDSINDSLDVNSQMAEWETALWILMNLCGIEAPIIDDLYRSIPFNIENYSEYSAKMDAPHKLAFAFLALRNGSSLDVNGGPNTLLSTVVDEECITLAKEHNLDLFSAAKEKYEEDGSKVTAKLLMNTLWTKHDSLSRPIEECIFYAKIASAPSKRAKLGAELAQSHRISDLMNASFDISLSRLYCGILSSSDDTTAFRGWIIEGMQKLTIEEWNAALESRYHGAVLDLLQQLKDYVCPINNLDMTMLSYIRNGKQFPLVNSILHVYNMDEVLFNNAISEAYFDSALEWKTIVKEFGDRMIHSNWIKCIQPVQRKLLVKRIIGSKVGYCLKWLYFALTATDSPKELMRGFRTNSVRALSNNLGLKAPSQEYKDYAKKLIALLS